MKPDLDNYSGLGEYGMRPCNVPHKITSGLDCRHGTRELHVKISPWKEDRGHQLPIPISNHFSPFTTGRIATWIECPEGVQK